MKIITDERCIEFSSLGHPERPARVGDTVKHLRAQTDLRLQWAKPLPADETAILRAHSKRHLARLKEPEDFDEDTPSYPTILDHARRSVGAALAALELVRAGEMPFSLMRPPGHHATRDQAMGFCYLNSAAIIALEALATGTKRVAVFDFDVHHGNGTEAILVNHHGTACYSIHQHPCYPGTGAADVGDNCFNFPVAPSTPRSEYRSTLSAALEKMLKFKPELVIVSAGFDAYSRDPLAQQTLEAEDFHWIGEELRKTAIPLVNLLEGGYSDDLPQLILAYLKGLKGK